MIGELAFSVGTLSGEVFFDEVAIVAYSAFASVQNSIHIVLLLRLPAEVESNDCHDEKKATKNDDDP